MKDIFKVVKEGSLEELRELIESDKTLVKEKDFKKRNLIMLAAERGDIDIFNYLLNKKAPLKGSDSEKNTALHYAMKGNNLDIIKTLTDKKINPKQLNKKNEPAIIWINKNTKPEIIDFLLNYHDLNEVFYTDYYEGNLLYFIVMYGSPELLKFILDKGADKYNDNYVYRALEDRSIEKAEILMSKGFNETINETQLINLFKKINSFEIVKFLVEKLKFEPSKNLIVDSFDELNVLQHYINEYYISDEEKLKIVKFLINNGADVNYLAYNDKDAMYFALKNNNIEIAKLLLKAGSSLDRLKDYSYSGDLKKYLTAASVRFIIENVKDMDLEKFKKNLFSVMTDDDCSVLDNFLKNDNHDDLKFFIDKFELDIQKEYFRDWNYKYSLFSRAVYLNLFDKIKLFLEMGADINKVDTQGNPVVYYALSSDDEKVVDILNLFIENGLDINAGVGKKKQNLLLSALLMNGYYAAKFLFEKGLEFKVPIKNYFRMKAGRIPPFKIIKLLIDNNIELDVSDIDTMGKILLSVSEDADDFIFLLDRYNIDLAVFDSEYLRKILIKVIDNEDLSKEKNFINFSKIINSFDTNMLSEDIKNELMKNSVKNLEIFKLLEDKFSIDLSDEEVLGKIIEYSVESGGVDTLNYLLSKSNTVIYDIYDTYKDILRTAKKRNKDRSYLQGYEERAVNFDNIAKILKKYDKDIQKKIEKGEVEEKEEVKLTKEEELIQKLGTPWIDLNKLPTLYFKNGEEISQEVILTILLEIKNFGYKRVLKELKEIKKESVMELFEYLRESSSKEMWIYDLLLALAEDNDDIYPILEEHIEKYGYSGGYHLQNKLINKLVEIENIEGLKFIYKLTKSKRNSIKNSANNAFLTKASKLGVSVEELKDMLIPDFGFNAERELELDYGARKITVKLTPDFKLTYMDKATGKIYKTLPKASKSDDENKVEEATKLVKKIKKEIKKIISDMKSRLTAQFIEPKYGKFSYWKRLFVENPILNLFATGLFWGVYKNDKLDKVFIYSEDGSFLDLYQNEIILNDNDLISILHPVELTKEELSKAQEFVNDFELNQPVLQIDRKFFVPKDKKAKKLTDFNGKKVKSNVFHYALTKAGFSRGMVEDNATIYTYYMYVKGVEVIVYMSGITLGVYNNDEIEIGDVIFDNMELGEVDSRLYSEVYLTLSSL